MGWIFLVLAGLLEIAVVVGVRKIALRQYVAGLPIYALGITSSLYFLYLAMRTIDVSIAYAAYTGIGVVGTVIFGMFAWSESRSKTKFVCLALILGSLVTLKMAS